MLWLKNESLEGFLKFSLLFLVLIICSLYTLLAWKFELAWHWIVVGEFPVILLCLWFVALIKQRVLRTFTRVCLYTEAIAKGEFEQFTKSPFSQGKVNELYQHLSLLSDNLQANTLTDEPKELFNLLNVLPAPVLIVNQDSEIRYANAALYEYTQCTPTNNDFDVISKLNLVNKNKTWQLASESSALQVLSSHVELEEKAQQLLIFIDYSSSQYELKAEARHQLIERIHALAINTITPIASLSEHVKNQHLCDEHLQSEYLQRSDSSSESDSIIKSCDAIAQSCENFSKGISRYMGFAKDISFNPQWITVSELLAPHQKNHPDLTLDIEQALTQVWCDVEQVQKILFDVIENAYEANAQKVNIVLNKHEEYAVLEIIDDGKGFKCTTQALEPFSSTKPQAEGLSLYFAKSIIENHSGFFECQNNEVAGATIMMILPFPSIPT